MPVAKPNYSFEKRQRDLAKKKKQDEKRLKKLAKGGGTATDSDAATSAQGPDGKAPG